MGRGLGSRPDAPGRMEAISRPLPVRSPGIYPRKGSRAGEYGGTAYATVIESYDRNSDYKRWRLGQEYYFGSGRSWADYSIHSFSHFAVGAVDNVSREIVSLFPSSTSPERAWYASIQTRGSIIVPQPLQLSAIRVDTSSDDPSQHTLTWDVTGILTEAQVNAFNLYIGDQFEDSATGTTYPGSLAKDDVGSMAFTLIAANVSTMSLVFDLSRPYGRINRNGRTQWAKLEYNPRFPMVWRPGRYICNSFKFFCSCPDHLGGAWANLEMPSAGSKTDRFPRPNTGRDVRSPWESQGAGYYRQWKTLPRRRDERRDCKHIHAMRWKCGVPWLEPDDYPSGDAREFLEFAAEAERRLYSEEIMEYFRMRSLNWDRYILAVAGVAGIILFPDGDPRNEERPDQRPLLWNDGTEPNPAWCRTNDWWLIRGTQQLRVFDPAISKFTDVVTIAGREYPVLEVVDPDVSGAPVIVP